MKKPYSYIGKYCLTPPFVRQYFSDFTASSSGAIRFYQLIISTYFQFTFTGQALIIKVAAALSAHNKIQKREMPYKSNDNLTKQML